MEIVEDSLPVSLETFLERPLFCFLGSHVEAGPRVTPLWFLWEDDALWIIANYGEKTYPHRVEVDSRVDVAIVDFEPDTGLVQHVGMRGHARIESFDLDRAERLLAGYLGEDRSRWDPKFTGPWDDRWRLIRVEPETVVARDQSYEASG